MEIEEREKEMIDRFVNAALYSNLPYTI